MNIFMLSVMKTTIVFGYLGYKEVAELRSAWLHVLIFFLLNKLNFWKALGLTFCWLMRALRQCVRRCNVLVLVFSWVVCIL